ncbi:dual oxidase maturation factor 1 [Chelonus insularis]|uniref:dual oxidase maturation factor 1 n=1 Tax=Chelonus insularis TaxID=460826 RepID=UPI00158DFBA1|nr:dual oxidase maturation factor 1 [Chelonus insularis]XP_034946210.1 dual oxidase maturation factor 1 [Chelonus insularis]
MKGWFDAFRHDGGPTLYSYTNRTPVTGDVHLITIFVVFCTIFTAFLIIFPGIRKERITTFFTVTLSLFVGTSIQVAQYGSTWHTTSSSIVSSYSVFSRHRTSAEIGGFIGLMHINITYSLINYTESTVDGVSDVEYNERFWWRSPTEMSESFKHALYRGAPFPIISLAEYFSLHQEGFSWGAKYREAGHYASIMLWTCFAAWLMMNLLLVVVPRYGAYSMVFTGVLMLCTNLTYWSLLPCEPLVAHIDGSTLVFDLGWNYWLVLVAGFSCLFCGIIITVIDLIFPHQFSTILEVDYDTPYDRHVIIEESFDTRNTRKKLPKMNEDDFDERVSSSIPSKLGSNSQRIHEGVVNCGFVSHEMSDFHHRMNDDSSKANWSYPFPPISRRVI